MQCLAILYLQRFFLLGPRISAEFSCVIHSHAAHAQTRIVTQLPHPYKVRRLLPGAKGGEAWKQLQVKVLRVQTHFLGDFSQPRPEFV